MRRVPLSRIVDLLDISHAPGRVAEYRAAMLAGARFPPIAVLPIAGRLIVADGHKRLHAYRMLDRPDISVQVWTVRRLMRDQWRQAVANARKNGTIVRLSLSDPMDAARLLGSTVRHWRRVARCLLRWRRS